MESQESSWFCTPMSDIKNPNSTLSRQLPLFIDPNILPTNKYHVSYSELFDWIECSYRHELKHVRKIALDSPSIHTEFGRTVHNVLENYITTREDIDDKKISSAIKEFEDLCVKLKEEHDVEVPEKDIASFSGELGGMAQAVPGWLEENFPGWKPFAGEYKLFEPIEGQTNKHFKGFIDAVIKVPINVRKTAKKTPSKKKGLVVEEISSNSPPPMRLSELTKTSALEALIPEVEGEREEPAFAKGYEFWILDWKTSSWGWQASKKRDFNKQLQLVLYKHFFCKFFGLRLNQVKCGFVLIKRTPSKKDINNRVELVTVSVGPKTEAKGVELLHNMLNQLQARRMIKNRHACRFCPYSGTKHCP